MPFQYLFKQKKNPGVYCFTLSLLRGPYLQIKRQKKLIFRFSSHIYIFLIIAGGGGNTCEFIEDRFETKSALLKSLLHGEAAEEEDVDAETNGGNAADVEAEKEVVYAVHHLVDKLEHPPRKLFQ